MTADHGRIESVCGSWVVTWDWRDVNGFLYYTVEDREGGGRYRAWHSGDLGRWVAVPEHMPTVDMERSIPWDDEYGELLLALEQAEGRCTDGILRFPKEER